jgi:hypothetical protein
MAKTICIINALGVQQFACANANFKDICKHYILPYDALLLSCINQGELIFQTEKALAYAAEHNFEKYIGWSAIEVDTTPEVALDAMVLENQYLGLYDNT